jgi:SAM-dependent methyltransferase
MTYSSRSQENGRRIDKVMSKRNVCPNCGESRISTFYDVRNVPVNSCLMMSTKKEALNLPRGDIILGFCENCGFIFNVAFDPSIVDYSSDYEDQQCFSSTFNNFVQNLATELIEKYNLHNKHILEIGCGKGDFLTLLCELGHNSGVGIDPAYVEGRIKSTALDRLTFIRDYYSERYANYHGDLVCCRHTLEHIHNTAKFVKNVRRAIGTRSDTVVFFEVPNVTLVLRELAFWDIYYEHCSYFNLGSLANLFRFCKFEVINLTRAFNDQYILIEAKSVSQLSNKVNETEESAEETAKYVKHFSEHCQNKLDQWKNRLQQIHAEKKRVVVWGSGSKCVSFLTTLDVKDEIEYVIDINPYRHGKFIPGAGKKIMPPEFLKKYKPNVTIVMNPTYCDEIRQMLEHMQVNTEVISV